jgi:hypothetical protein
MIVRASGELLKYGSLIRFTSGVLTQITSLLGLEDDSALMQVSSFAASCCDGDFRILAGTGQFEPYIDKNACDFLEDHIKEYLKRAITNRLSFLDHDRFVGYFRTNSQSEYLLY